MSNVADSSSSGSSSDALTAISVKFNVGDNAPDDLILRTQVDNKQLTVANNAADARVTSGDHTVSWAVLSPTVRPFTFGVSITAGDRQLLNRSKESTGADGRGVGADEFTV